MVHRQFGETHMPHSNLHAAHRGRSLLDVSFRTALAVAMLVALSGAAKPAHDDEACRRSTAVTLNYCRASFYRIQKSPTLHVLVEEQEKILNNLDLNGIADQEVVKLYTGVLVEISEVRMADRERHVIQEKYRTALGTVLTGDAFDFGTQLASAQYLAAVRTGARSWWDYRNTETGRDSDVFHADQKRLMAFTDKSGQFLDTFWKLARDRKIPDRWLVRNQDLSKLDAAMRERDLLVRLRVLKRMQDFMAYYPPYWYYVARTQQALGQLSSAAKTYEKLFTLGQGHFRKDDMLAAGLANRAMIQDYLHQPCAAETALKALGYSTDVWEANLMCARVLGRNGRVAEAEDAVLRNLDVDLEREQSVAALVSLYTLQGKVTKLRARLTDPALVRSLPMPLLIRAAAVLGPRKLPEAIVAHWASSLAAHYELNYGPDDFVLVTTPLWNLQASEMSLVVGDESFRQSTIALTPGRSEVRFAKIGEIGHPLYASSNPPPAVLIVKFPDAPLVRLKLDARAEIAGTTSAATSFPVVDMLASASLTGRHQNLFLASVQIGETEFAVASRLAGGIADPGEAVDEPPSPPVEFDQPSATKPATATDTTAAGSPASAAPKTESTPAKTESTPPKTESISPKAGQASPPTTDSSTAVLPPVPRLAPPKLPTFSTMDGPKLFP
jgi:hypothetical protein